MSIIPLSTDTDPGAVFAASLSLHSACKEAEDGLEKSLSDSYEGYDEFLRECARVGTLFEEWTCANVDFDESDLELGWIYQLEGHFGEAVLSLMGAEDLAQFDEESCRKITALWGLDLLEGERQQAGHKL